MATKVATIRVLRIIARIWSLLSIGFILLIFVGEALNGERPAPTPLEWFGLALFPGGVLLGLIIAWRYEGLGGIVTLSSLGAFYIWNFLQSGRLAGGPFFFLAAAPGLLFLICCMLERRCPTSQLGIRRTG